MKKIPIIVALLTTFMVAKGFYQTYHYLDQHHVRTRIKDQVNNQFLEINATLHVRYLEENRSNYALFWLEAGQRSKSAIDRESIYAPFVVRYNPDGFILKELNSLSIDRKVQQKLMGVVELLQFQRSKEGVYRLPNALGELEVNASKINHHYRLTPLAQYTKKIKREDIHHYASYTQIEENNQSIWQTIQSQQTVKLWIKAMESTIRDRREFNLTLSSNQLPKNHWFFDLPIDLSAWKFTKGTSSMLSLSLAQKLYDNKMAELKALLNSRLSIEEWVRENLDFLAHLSEMLEDRTLDNQVSKSLFAELGYINNTKSVKILSEVALNENIKNKERFRGLMGLKNSSAPIEDETLDKILSMGLSGEGGEIEETMGMLIGALAYQRVDRVPKQYEKINDALLNALSDNQNRSLVLGAIGNMRQSASDEIVQGVEDILSNPQNNRERVEGAEALLQIDRSTLPLSKIEKMVLSEKNSNTASLLIRTTEIAEDSSSNRGEQYQFLTNIAQEQTRMKSNRIAALETLSRAGYGKTKEEKQKIRQMMLKEKDSDVQKILREIYRK